MSQSSAASAERIRVDLQKRMSDIAAQSSDMRSELDSGLASFIDENNATVVTLRKQLSDLRKTATDGRAKLDEQMKADGDAAKSKADAITGSATKADVFGTFSTAASFGIGMGSSAADRTATACESSSKDLKAIREKILTGQSATFAP